MDSSDAQIADRHVPVMRDRCVELLAAAAGQPGAVLVDATLGLGGHTQALLTACPQATVVGIDRDPEALALAGKRLASFGERSVRVRARYDEITQVLSDLGIDSVQGILMDLGVSSMQLDEAERGFAYAIDAPLDMRMDPTQGISAAQVLNTYDAGALTHLLRAYGEEKFAARIAHTIVREREREPFTNSYRLVELVKECTPQAARRTGGNPAKRTFQALRIEVNGELDSLKAALPAAVDALAVGGRLVVMSYQSLEDRMVKAELANGARSATPPGLPVEIEEFAPRLRLLTRGSEKPSAAELESNPRSAPARLRAAERIRPGRLGHPDSSPVKAGLPKSAVSRPKKNNRSEARS